jgi:L-asparaginase II
MRDAGLPWTGSDLALASASHSGEPFHLEAVDRLLAAIGLDETALQCPPDLPYGEQARAAYLAQGRAPSRVAMNCSGKHTAMLTTCVGNDWPLETYLAPGHPLQVAVQALIEELAGSPVARTSVDGCGAPLWALPLVGLARAFVRLPRYCPDVVAAVREYPEYTGGSTRDVTHLMRGVPGLTAKDGAEAVQAMVLEHDGRRYGVALKISDGAQRARPVVAAAVLRSLGVDAPVLDEHLSTPVLGGGRPVGRLRPRM